MAGHTISVEFIFVPGSPNIVFLTAKSIVCVVLYTYRI